MFNTQDFENGLWPCMLELFWSGGIPHHALTFLLTSMLNLAWLSLLYWFRAYHQHISLHFHGGYLTSIASVPIKSEDISDGVFQGLILHQIVMCTLITSLNHKDFEFIL